jgi:hypothetical protein
LNWNPIYLQTEQKLYPKKKPNILPDTGKKLYTKKKPNILPDTEERLYTKEKKNPNILLPHTEKKMIHNENTSVGMKELEVAKLLVWKHSEPCTSGY